MGEELIRLNSSEFKNPASGLTLYYVDHPFGLIDHIYGRPPILNTYMDGPSLLFMQSGVRFLKCYEELTPRQGRVNSWELTPLDSTCIFYMSGILESWIHVGAGGKIILLPGVT